MLKEFKEFAMKGNIVDLAVAVIIGGAFGKIVTRLTERYYHAILLAMILGTGGVSEFSCYMVGKTVFLWEILAGCYRLYLDRLCIVPRY